MMLCLNSYFKIERAGKELFSWRSVCAGLLYAVLIVCLPFPFGMWDNMWNLIVSIPDHCLLSTLLT